MVDKEYIEREAAITKIREEGVYGSGYSDEEREDDVVDMIESIPAADVRPVVRGKWSRIDYEPHGHDYKCSACEWKNDMPTHFCPNCGAMMEES